MIIGMVFALALIVVGAYGYLDWLQLGLELATLLVFWLYLRPKGGRLNSRP